MTAPDWRSVRLNESSHWDPKFIKENDVDKMYGVYLVNFNSVTHCCSLTPSFELNFVGSVYTGGPEDDEGREQLFEAILAADQQSELVKYIYCKDLNKALTEVDQHKIELDKSDWEDDEDRGFEHVRDYYCGNPTW